MRGILWDITGGKGDIDRLSTSGVCRVISGCNCSRFLRVWVERYREDRGNQQTTQNRLVSSAPPSVEGALNSQKISNNSNMRLRYVQPWEFCTILVKDKS